MRSKAAEQLVADDDFDDDGERSGGDRAAEDILAALDEAEEQYRRGEVYPAEQVLAEMRAILYK